MEFKIDRLRALIAAGEVDPTRRLPHGACHTLGARLDCAPRMVSDYLRRLRREERRLVAWEVLSAEVLGAEGPSPSTQHSALSTPLPAKGEPP